jgi:WD40 repeat protein
MSEPAAFYVTGGTLPPDSASYIERAADSELLTSLGRSELCYVLNARQMGKSSLSVKTRHALEASGTRTAFLDLQKFGSSASAEQWYRALLERIGHDLKLRPQFLAYWRDNGELPPLTRLFNALREIALVEISGNLVIFLDEIDVVRDLSFKTDEFFGAIRETHNARADDPTFKRLTFCIIGTVAPTDLIRDVRLSPFNIGTRIKLADFTPTEAAPLAVPLPGTTKTLERVLWWTSGHPYLTQRLCAELTKTQSTDVDGEVARLFFAKSDADVDENIKNVRNGVLRMGGEGAGFDRTDLLTRYEQLARGKRVTDDDTDGVCTALRLSGLVTAAGGFLTVRNRVYAKLFDAAWVRENLPDAELRRQRAAVSKARWQVGSIAAGVLLLMGGLTGWALSNANRADVAAKKALASASAESVAKTEAQSAQAKAVASARAEGLAKTEAQKQAEVAQMAATQANAATAKAELALKGESVAKAAALASATQAQQSATRATEQARRADREASAARVQTGIATANADMANRLAYISNCNLAQRAIENNQYKFAQQNLNEMGKLLKNNPHLEAGYEWTYLNEQMHLEQLELKGHSGGVNSVAYSADGTRIVTGSDDGTARIWNVSTGKEIIQIKPKSICSLVKSVAISPDGTKIVVIMFPSASQSFQSFDNNAFDNNVYVFDSKSGRELLKLKGHTRLIYSVAFFPDGKRILTCSFDDTARVWDSITGNELIKIGHIGSIMCVAISPDGNRIITGNEPPVPANNIIISKPEEKNGPVTTRIWDSHTGSELLQINSEGSSSDYSPNCVSFSPDGKRILKVSGSRIRTYDSFTGQKIKQFNGQEYIYTAVFCSDNRILTLGRTSQITSTYACIWDAVNGNELFQIKGHENGISSVAMSPDGKHILTGGFDYKVRVWSSMLNRVVYEIKHPTDTSSITSVIYSPDGKYIAIAGLNGIVRIRDAITGREYREIKAGTAPGNLSVAISPDGKRLLTGCNDNDAKNKKATCIWDFASGKKILQLNNNSIDANSVAFSHDGKRIITGNADHIARIWDSFTGREILEIKGHSRAINSAVFSSDDKRILTISDHDAARIWDSVTGHQYLKLNVPLGLYSSGVFSPDGKRILIACDDNTVRVLDSVSGHELFQLNGHSNVVKSVVFSTDGKRILTGGDDSTVRVWDSATGREILQLKSIAVKSLFAKENSPNWINNINIRSVAFSPDGKSVLTGSNEGIVCSWRKVTDDQALEIERIKIEQEKIKSEERLIKVLPSVPLSKLVSTSQAILREHPTLKSQIGTILNDTAWNAVDPTKPTPTSEIARQALEVATLAVQYTDGKNGLILDTLAAAQFACGDLDGALSTERKAVALLPNDKELKAALTRYEKLKAEKTRKPTP